jgi:hypothetical protein
VAGHPVTQKVLGGIGTHGPMFKVILVGGLLSPQQQK